MTFPRTTGVYTPPPVAGSGVGAVAPLQQAAGALIFAGSGSGATLPTAAGGGALVFAAVGSGSTAARSAGTAAMIPRILQWPKRQRAFRNAL